MMGKKFFLTTFLTAAIIFNFWGGASVVNAQSDAPTRAFVLLAEDDAQQLTQVQAFVTASGGRTFHVFPHQALIAALSSGAVQSLAELPGVAAVFTQAVELSTVDSYGPNVRRFASVWNSLVAPHATPPDASLMATGHPDDPNDALTAPDLPPDDGTFLKAAGSVTPGYYQTSEYMAGSVAVGIVLVESDGSVDPSTEDWTPDEKQQVFNEVVNAFNWWAELEPRANLSFVYDDHFSNPLPTGVEPITRPYYDQQYWIGDAMSALGYDASSYFARVRDYDNDLRTTYQTDWAFTIFVVDSSTDSDNRFSDGYFAYAYLGGPFMVLTYGNDGYGTHNMDAVAAHEMGHIFNALDQYYDAHQPCTRRAGYLHVENQNSQYGDCVSNESSIMRGQVFPYAAGAIDPYAAGQIGWRDSDGDDILDPLDTELPISIGSVSVESDSVTISGTTESIPYPSPSRTSVTINTLTGVQYRIDGGEWQPAVADDGAFDGTTEDYHFTAHLPPGQHTLEVTAVDSAGNVSDDGAAETVPILDPVDGGLNTELHQPSGISTGGKVADINGEAYHLEGVIVTGVEYRIDGGPWHPAEALDGAFDSDYETFVLEVGSLGAGAHVIEARAIDGDGDVEVNFASREFTVAYTVFLPLTLNGI